MQPGGIHLQPLSLPAENTFFRGLGIWRYRTETAAPPASGQVRFNNADPSLATELYLHETNDGGVDVETFLELLTDGALIYLQEASDSDNKLIIEISSNVDSGTYRTFGIENIILEGVEPSQNTEMICVVSLAGAGASGNVFKVGTPVDNQVGVWTGDGTIEGDPLFTFDAAALKLIVGVPIYLIEQAAAGFSFSGQGQFWVRDDLPTTAMFTNSFGQDRELIGSDGSGGSSRIAFFDTDREIVGDANLTYGFNGNPEQMMIQVVTNTINEVGLLIIDSDSVLNPVGWAMMPGQAGLFDGVLIISDDPTDVVNNRNVTHTKNNATAFGKGCSVALDVAFKSESAGALAFFMPQDTTGREETKISGVGEVGGTGHEGLVSIEVYAYGDSGLNFERMCQFVQDADQRLHTDFYTSIQLGIIGQEAPIFAGDNAAIGYTQADGLQLIGQGTTNDLVIFDDTHQLAMSKPTGSAAFRFHQRFAAGRYFQIEQGNQDATFTGVLTADVLWSGYLGEFNIDSDLTVQGDLVVVGVRPSGTVEWDKGADIASATTLVLGSDGNSFDVTGTTDIEAISAKPIGTVIILQFDAVARLIHDATALDLDGDVDMVPEANDTIGLYCYDGTNWRELFRTDGQGVRVSGSIADQAMVRGNGGAKRVQDTGNLIGDDDEIIMAGTVILQSFTDAQLNDNGNSVNTNDGKAAGAMVFNSSQGHAVTAQGSGSGDVWNDGVGTLTNTPV